MPHQVKFGGDLVDSRMDGDETGDRWSLRAMRDGRAQSHPHTLPSQRLPGLTLFLYNNVGWGKREF